MFLYRKLTGEQYFLLFEYARYVLKENPKCSEIMRWVRGHNCELEKFFLVIHL